MITLLLLAHLQAASPAEAARPPRLRNPESILSSRDYPAESLSLGQYGIVSVILYVSPEGKVSACDVTESSGFASLDARTCTLLRLRARFDPAVDTAGAPAAGVYRMANSWGADTHLLRTDVSLPLQVSRLPADYKTPMKARLIFDPTGHVSACEVTDSSGSDAADRAACAYVSRELVLPSPKTRSDKVPAAAVRYLTASLSIGPAKTTAN